MGCSVGVPNYFGPPGASADEHLEKLLQQAGNQVHNCSSNGGSNLQTLWRAKEYLSGRPIAHPAFTQKEICLQKQTQVDCVIWFHTALFRDWNHVPGQKHNLVEDVEIFAHYIYREFAEFFDSLGCKIAIIGGAGDVHPVLNDYIAADFLIPSLRQHVIVHDNIFDNSAIDWIDFDKISNTTSEKINYLDSCEQVFTTLKSSNLYPDNSHPGKEVHKILFKELSTLLTTT